MSDVDELDAHRHHWRREVWRELIRWRHDDRCPTCNQWVGHFAGDAQHPPCEAIPLNVQLEEVRPNCLVVRRPWIGDAIRAACRERRGGSLA